MKPSAPFGEVVMGILLMVVAAASASGCGFFCTGGSCGWSDQEKSTLNSLSGLAASAPADPSNRYVGDPNAQTLGKALFFDTRFSGSSNVLDALNRPMPYGRAQKGQPTAIGCITCHDFGNGSVDAATEPGNVSLGAGWTFSNSSPTINSALYKIQMWNGRQDSLWGQALSDNENPQTTNGNRLHTAWLINDLYHDPYQAVFTDYPLPFGGPSSQWQSLLETDPGVAGQCKLVGGLCPTSCRVTPSTSGNSGCWPRFPLQGKPGKTAGCQSGNAGEPFGDAFDCMDSEDQKLITRALVNFGKAIASYEFTLVANTSPFDRWIADLKAGNEDDSTAISTAAKQGARLFVGKAGCSDCHNTALLSDSKFHNVAVAQSGPAVPTVADCPAGGVCDCAPATDTHPGPKNCLPWGAYDGIDKLQRNAFRRDGIWSDDATDVSRMPYVSMALNTTLVGQYRTPSLRNVALTAPYMHNGSIGTLEEVVAHYNVGGQQDTPGAPAAQMKPLYLDTSEQSQLVEFLKSLTSDPLPAELTAPPVLP